MKIILLEMKAENKFPNAIVLNKETSFRLSIFILLLYFMKILFGSRARVLFLCEQRVSINTGNFFYSSSHVSVRSFT